MRLHHQDGDNDYIAETLGQIQGEQPRPNSPVIPSPATPSGPEEEPDLASLFEPAQGIGERLYRLFAYTGLCVLIWGKRVLRRLWRQWDKVLRWWEHSQNKRREKWEEWKRQWRHSVLGPLSQDRAILLQSLAALEGAKQGNWRQRTANACSALGGLFRFLGRFITRSLHYICPAAALLLLLSTISYYNSQTYGIIVEYQGTQLGLVESEDAYGQAEEVLQSRIVYADNSEKVVSTPTFTLTRVSDESDFSTPEEVCDNLIAISGEMVQTLSGLYINNLFYGAVDDEEALRDYLDTLLEAQGTGDPDETLVFADDVMIRSGLYPVSSQVELSQLCQTIGRQRGEDRTYVVQQGDTLQSIANSARTSKLAIQELNQGLTDETLTSGETIQISKALPFLSVGIITEEQYTEPIPYEVREIEDARLAVGNSSLVTPGEEGEQLVTAQVERVNGVEVARVITDIQVIKPAVDEERTVGSYAGTLSEDETLDLGISLVWPLDGGYYSCGIWEYSGHTGVDLAGSFGANVYAAESGTVQIAKSSGWNGGYGQYVVIDHGNGLLTLYAHCSAVYVQPGATVRKGDVIAAVGQSGNASGNHLHIELRKNGVFLDPLDYMEGIIWSKGDSSS